MPHRSTPPARFAAPVEHAPLTQTVHLARGGQAVINGALVTASEACSIEVGSGAFVLTGRTLWRTRGQGLRNPREELYFSIIDAATSPARFEAERFRLFALLGQVVTQERTHQGQRECTLLASALLAGNTGEAVDIAARLAADAVDRERSLPGRLAAARKRPKPIRSESAAAQA